MSPRWPRMMNHDRFDANFWDQSFRLIVNGVPMAPESGLNELVSAESTQEGIRSATRKTALAPTLKQRIT
jgi:hypothetical protein